MSHITVILENLESGGSNATEELLSLVYDELRRLAASKMAHENPGHTLQATALVHEAWLRLLGPDGAAGSWENRRHFFSAAAEAMRRILIESARRKQSRKRDPGQAIPELDESISAFVDAPEDELLAVNDALDRLEAENADLARLVKLRYFAGMTIAETAEVMGASTNTVDRHWATARAWLYREINR